MSKINKGTVLNLTFQRTCPKNTLGISIILVVVCLGLWVPLMQCGGAAPANDVLTNQEGSTTASDPIRSEHPITVASPISAPDDSKTGYHQHQETEKNEPDSAMGDMSASAEGRPSTTFQDDRFAAPKDHGRDASEETGARDKATGTSTPAKTESSGESSRPGDKPARPTEKKPEASKPSTSGLAASFVDDNKQFNYFVDFLAKFQNQVTVYPINIKDRIVFHLMDSNKKSLANAAVSVYGEKNELIATAKTYADGTFTFYPSEASGSGQQFRLEAQFEKSKQTVKFTRNDQRSLDVVFPVQRPTIKKVPIDMVFVMDTTGSMSEEIERLKTTIDIIYYNVSEFSSKPDVQLGMVLYRDQNDEYRTKVIPLTADLEAFKEQLSQVEVDGGGDTPEDLQEALKDCVTKISWRSDGVRLAFVVTDAPPHLDYQQGYTYVSASQEAKQKALKIFTIGTGGLDLQGEYILRQVAQYTSAHYIFLHYGEGGESSGGSVGSVSHHTGSNYQVDKLEAILIRAAKQELSYLTDEPIETPMEYYEATKVPNIDRDATLTELFKTAVTQLINYSTLHLDKQTPATVMPVASKSSTLLSEAEYFTERLAYSVSQADTFKMVDRDHLQKLIQEMEIQSSDFFDSSNAVKVGKLIGAQLMIIGNVYEVKDKKLEMFLKLVRVETGEILSVSKLMIDSTLRL